MDSAICFKGFLDGQKNWFSNLKLRIMFHKGGLGLNHNQLREGAFMLLRKAAGDLMIESVLTAKESQKVLEVAKTMAKENVGALMVVNKNNEPVGIFTERDLLKRVVAQGLDPAQTEISKVMTTSFKSVGSDADIEDLTEIMVEGNFRHLPVIDQKVLVGILSIRDLARYLAGLPQKKTAAAAGTKPLKKLD